VKTIWEKRSGKDRRVGFYLKENSVLFEYSRPFDTKTWEWAYARGCFLREDFEECIEALEHGVQCEVTGTHGEKLKLSVSPRRTLRLELWAGQTGNVVIPDLGIGPSRLRIQRTGH
jgi:hypothetical protein